MFFVSLLCIALFSQAFAQEVQNEEDDGSLAIMEAAFAAEFPVPYKILDFVRIMLGIPKDRMLKFAMKALEVVGELQELWELLLNMFRKEPPTANANTAKQQSAQIPVMNNQYYYGY